MTPGLSELLRILRPESLSCGADEERPSLGLSSLDVPHGWPSAQTWLLCAVHSCVAWLQPFSPTARFPEAKDSLRVLDTLPGHGVSLAQGPGGLRSGDVWHLPCWRAECGCWRAGMWPRGAACEGLCVGLDTAGGHCLPRLWRACRWLGCGRGPLGRRPACSTPLSLPALPGCPRPQLPRSRSTAWGTPVGGTVGRTEGLVAWRPHAHQLVFPAPVEALHQESGLSPRIAPSDPIRARDCLETEIREEGHPAECLVLWFDDSETRRDATRPAVWASEDSSSPASKGGSLRPSNASFRWTWRAHLLASGKCPACTDSHSRA